MTGGNALDKKINALILHIFKPTGEELNLANKLEIDVTEITSHGIEFRTFFCLQKKMSFCFDMPLDEDSKIILVAEISDIVEEKDEYVYKCKYLHLSTMEEERINSYLSKHLVRKEG